MILRPAAGALLEPEQHLDHHQRRQPAQADLPALGDRRLGQLPVPLVRSRAGRDRRAATAVVGRAVAVLAVGAPGAGRHRARAQRRAAAAPAGRPGTAPSSCPARRRNRRECAWHSRSLPRRPPATSAGTRAPRTRPGGPAAAAAPATRRSRPALSPARSAGRSTASTARRSWRRARWRRSRRPGRPPGPAADARRAGTAPGSPGSQPASARNAGSSIGGQPRRPARQQRPRPARRGNSLPVPAAGDAASAAAAPVTGSPRACSRGLGTASTAARSRAGSGCSYTCEEDTEAWPSRSATTSMPHPASATLLPNACRS